MPSIATRANAPTLYQRRPAPSAAAAAPSHIPALSEWYAGKIGRPEAANFILGEGAGAYFVHQNPTDDTTFYLTACDGGNAAQYKVKYDNGDFTLGQQTFRSLEEVCRAAKRQGLRGKSGHFVLATPSAARARAAAGNADAAAASSGADVSSSGAVAMQATFAAADTPVRVASKQRPSLVDVDASDIRNAKHRNAKDRLKNLGAKMGAKFSSVRHKLARGSEDPSAAAQPRVTAPPVHGNEYTAMPLPHSLADRSEAAPARSSRPSLAAGAGPASAPRSASSSSSGASSSEPDVAPPPVAPRPPVVARHDSMSQIHAKEEEAQELAEVRGRGGQAAGNNQGCFCPSFPVLTSRARPFQELEDLDGPILPLDIEGYKRLPRKAIKPTDLPPHARGMRLNRFRDILPNPVTRIRLPELKEDPTLEYINANYIRGYGGRNAREYIAAQAPTDTGIYNFWRMIRHTNVKIIVMATGNRGGAGEKEANHCGYGPCRGRLLKVVAAFPFASFLTPHLRHRPGRGGQEQVRPLLARAAARDGQGRGGLWTSWQHHLRCNP